MNLTSFVRNLFKSNSAKLADFRALVAEFEGENSRMANIAAEEKRLTVAMGTARSKVNSSFAVEDVKLLAQATRSLEDFRTASNWVSSFFGSDLQARQSSDRVRGICRAALAASREILEKKISELQRSDADHFQKLGLDGAACGDSAPVAHLKNLIARVEDLAVSVDGSGFSWPDVRELLLELSEKV